MSITNPALPTIAKMRHELEQWIKDTRQGRVLERNTNVIDSNAVLIFQDGPTGATFKIDIEELVT